MLLTVHRFGHDDFREPSSKPAVVGHGAQRPVESRRRHLESVPMVDRLLDIQNRTDVPADPFAVLDGRRRVHRGRRLSPASTWSGVAFHGTSTKIRSTQPEDSRRNWRSKTSRSYERATRSATARILSMSCVGTPSKTKSGHRPTSGLAGSYKPKSLSYVAACRAEAASAAKARHQIVTLGSRRSRPTRPSRGRRESRSASVK